MGTQQQLPHDKLPSSFIIFSDPGHSWLQVPKTALEFLKIHNKISGYSYQRGDMAYLEEDCDMITFIEAFLPHHGYHLHDKQGWQFFHSLTTDLYTDYPSPVRYMNHY